MSSEQQLEMAASKLSLLISVIFFLCFVSLVVFFNIYIGKHDKASDDDFFSEYHMQQLLNKSCIYCPSSIRNINDFLCSNDFVCIIQIIGDDGNNTYAINSFKTLKGTDGNITSALIDPEVGKLSQCDTKGIDGKMFLVSGRFMHEDSRIEMDECDIFVEWPLLLVSEKSRLTGFFSQSNKC